MKRLSTYPASTPDAAPNDYGLVNNETSPGAQDGTPVDANLWNDPYNAMYALLVDQGVTPSGATETTAASDFLTALKSLVTSSDTAFAPIDAGTVAVVQSTIGPYVYTVADFKDGGVTVANIRGIYVKWSCAQDQAQGTPVLTATYPGGGVHRLWSQDTNSGTQNRDMPPVFVPINEGTATVTLEISGISGGSSLAYTIIGAQQRLLP